MILARAPLRISLGGGGTDLPSYYTNNAGFVVSAAINKYVFIYVNRPASDKLIRLAYSQYEEVAQPDQVRHDLVRPTLQMLDIQDNIQITSMADVPAGTGLGSSGAYLVALLNALYELKNERVPIQALAELACHVEMNLAGHPVGKHDHYMAAFGGITCLDIDRNGTVKVSPLNISITVAEELGSRVLLFFTGITRKSSDILDVQRRDTERGDTSVVDSLHRTKELGFRIKEALEQANLDEFGTLLHEHWENKKRRSGLITDPHIERWYGVARKAGALGGKIIGAGGGGFLMFYCPAGSKGAVREALAAEGLNEMSYVFEYQGAKVIVNL